MKKNINPELEKLLTDKVQLPSNYIDKITDKIYLGEKAAFKDLEYFSKEKITHVLSLIDFDFSLPEGSNLVHKLISIEDDQKSNLFKIIKECIEFIEKSEKIFIHCMYGVSRSPSIVIAYLMWKTHCSYYDTYFFVKNRRRFIDPNDGFVEQLKLFEKLIKKDNYDLNKIEQYSCKDKNNENNIIK